MSKNKPVRKPDTVADLIKHLQTLDQSLPIGRKGNFGEFHPMITLEFIATTSHLDSWTPGGFETTHGEDIPVMAIIVPDIGDEPD